MRNFISSAKSSFVEHHSINDLHSNLEFSLNFDNSSRNDGMSKMHQTLQTFQINSLVIDKLDSMDVPCSNFPKDCFFDFFYIDTSMGERLIKEKSMEILRKLVQLNLSIPFFNDQMVRVNNELAELKEQFKNEKKKIVNIILAKENEVELAKQSLEELVEALKLKDENIKLVEENIMLKNKLENHILLQKKWKKKKESRTSEEENQPNIPKVEKLNERNTIFQISTKLGSLKRKKSVLLSKSQKICAEIEKLNLDLEKNEGILHAKTVKLRSQKMIGVYIMNIYESGKSEFDQLIESIEDLKVQTKTIKKSLKEANFDYKSQTDQIAELEKEIINLVNLQKNYLNEYELQISADEMQSSSLSEKQNSPNFISPKSPSGKCPFSLTKNLKFYNSPFNPKFFAFANNREIQIENTDEQHFSEEQTICLKNVKLTNTQKILKLKLLIKNLDLMKNNVESQVYKIESRFDNIIHKFADLKKKFGQKANFKQTSTFLQEKGKKISFFNKNVKPLETNKKFHGSFHFGFLPKEETTQQESKLKFDPLVKVTEIVPKKKVIKFTYNVTNDKKKDEVVDEKIWKIFQKKALKTEVQIKEESRIQELKDDVPTNSKKILFSAFSKPKLN